MSKNIYAWLSGMSFLVAGNIFEANNKSWFGWWNIPAFGLIILGYAFMDSYAKRYRK